MKRCWSEYLIVWLICPQGVLTWLHGVAFFSFCIILPRTKAGTLLKNARERIPTNCPDDVRSNRGIGYKAERQAQLDIGVIMRFDGSDGSSRHSKLKPENLEIWKTFIIDQLEGLRPSRLQNRLKIGAHAVLRNVPYFIRTIELQTLFRKYRAWCLSRQITSSRMLGHNTFCQLTQAVSCSN